MGKARFITAICFNLFLGPGAGQWLIKKKSRAIFFMLLFSVLLTIFVGHIGSLAYTQVTKTPPNGTDLNSLWQFSENMTHDVLSENSGLIKFYVFLLGVCYIASVADMFWLYVDAKEKEAIQEITATSYPPKDS